jgi:serine protease Do
VADRGLPALVPASLLQAAAEELARGRGRAQGDLGISWQRLTPAIARATEAPSGVVVAQVAPGGPADGALFPGDVVHGIDGRTIDSLADARLADASLVTGQPASLQVVRDRQRIEVSIVPREAPRDSKPSPPATLGLTTRTTREGLEVVRVTPGSAADLAGFRPADLITHIDRQPITATNNLVRAWDDAPAGRSWLLTVIRSDASLVIAIVKP